MSDELPHDIDDHVARVFGQADEAPEFYATRRASDLFEPFGPDCRGLGVGRPTEVAQLLEGRPRKFRFLTADQLRSAGSDGVEAVDRSRQQRRGQFREQDAVSRHVYSQVAAGRGSEYGFRHGRDLAAAVGYAAGDLAAVPPATLDRFVGLGHPWVMGRAEPGWRCLDLGCGVGVDVFVAAGQVGPRGHAVGVDLAPGMVRAVNDAASAAGVGHASAIEGSASAVPLADGSVDLVTANGLLVLVREPQQVLAEIARVLRPGGRLCFADTVFGEAATSGVVDDLEYWNRLTHGRPFIHEVVALLERADFTDVEVGPQVDPFEPTVDHGQVWGRTFSSDATGSTGDMIDADHIPATWRPSPSAGVVALPADDELVLWGPAVLVPELLPRVEAVIWSFVDGDTSVGELAADIAEVFHATPDKALFDLQRLLTQWVHLGLVDDDVEGLDGSGAPGTDPIPGPDPDRHPLQSPAVAPHGAVSDLVRWHEARKRVVRAGRLTFAVSIEDADDVPDLVERLAPLTVDDDGRRRYAVLRQRKGDHADRPWLVLSDVGLPLLRTDDPAVVTDTVTRLVSEVVDRQTRADVAWFRFAWVERGDTAVLVQHELLYAYPVLVAALAARGFTLHPADYVAVDDDGRLVRFANRLVAGAPSITLDDPPRVDARRRIAGIVVAGGPELGPAPTTEAERRWLLALMSCIGHDPRADGWARRWAVTAPLARLPFEVVGSCTPADAVAALDRIAAADGA